MQISGLFLKIEEDRLSEFDIPLLHRASQLPTSFPANGYTKML